MKFFKNKRQLPEHQGSDKAAGWIARAILKIQQSWASVMGRFMQRLSPASRNVVLITAGLLMTGYSLALVIFSFQKAGGLFLKPIAISQPISIAKPDPVIPKTVPSFIKRIERFKHYLDSLSNTIDGKRIRDSLILQRPGLLDSIQKIETIYCSK